MVCTMGSWSDHGNRTNEGVSKWLLREEVIQQWRARSTAMSKPTIPCGGASSGGEVGGGLELQSDKRVPWTCRHGATEWSTLLLWL